MPEVNFIDDGAGKPVGINEFIGRRPIAAFGISSKKIMGKFVITGPLKLVGWISTAERKFSRYGP